MARLLGLPLLLALTTMLLLAFKLQQVNESWVPVMVEPKSIIVYKEDGKSEINLKAHAFYIVFY